MAKTLHFVCVCPLGSLARQGALMTWSGGMWRDAIEVEYEAASQANNKRDIHIVSASYTAAAAGIHSKCLDNIWMTKVYG